jgi:hypothetical protein
MASLALLLLSKPTKPHAQNFPNQQGFIFRPTNETCVNDFLWLPSKKVGACGSPPWGLGETGLVVWCVVHGADGRPNNPGMGHSSGQAQFG